MTPLSLPLVHNKIPLTGLFSAPFGFDSYTDWPQLPYWRFPKISDVERGDPVVFNYPAEDIRPINMEGKVRPIDKREHYVKRCVGIPGDTLRITDGKVTVSGKTLEIPYRANLQTSYYVETNGMDFNSKTLKEKFDINYIKGSEGEGEVTHLSGFDPNVYIINISDSAITEFKTLPNLVHVTPLVGKTDMAEYSNIPEKLMQLYMQIPTFGVNQDLFPNPKEGGKLIYKWSRDNYGPLYIPNAGDVIELNRDNLYKYSRIITAYEHNTLEVKDGKVLINGSPAETYTFKQGYYWMMGDNRHASDDSRYWGFVPEDHIVGKPVFIWMSYDKFGEGLKKIRFDRVFTTVSGDGPRTSYFFPFLIVVAGIYGFNYWRKKKKKEAA